MFPTLIPLGARAGALRAMHAPAKQYQAAIDALDREVARLKERYPERFQSTADEAEPDPQP